jgi:hypothetical protein
VKPPETPQVRDIDMQAVEQMATRVQKQISHEDSELIQLLISTLGFVMTLLRARNTTLARLRRLFHLSGSEKTSQVLPEQSDVPENREEAAEEEATEEGSKALPSTPPPEPPAPSPKPPAQKRKGHGRLPASAYGKAEVIAVPHQDLRVGDHCPVCPKGTLYRIAPEVVIRIFGQAPLHAKRWELERLRCSACGTLFTARPPEEAQGSKYDETAISIMALLRYGSGMPIHRLAHLQKNLQTPVPASTQWDAINKSADVFRIIHEALRKKAAQGEVLHNDDSYMRILEYLGKRRAALLTAGKLPDPDRTGLFTTAILSLVPAIGPIALFITGRKHAGENLDELLGLREAGLEPPIQMSDALSRNVPKGTPVQESNCMSHGRRQIVDEIDNYPTECGHLLKQLGQVYKVDKECKKAGCTDTERLKVHQEKSGPIMVELELWMTAQLEEKRVEPNSGFGKALNYFVKRWEKFTLFLRVPGAPLDNNIAERALKMAINHRKNSLFYYNQRGAEVGDMFMSLIHTTELHDENPYDYLTELQRHAKEVAEHPEDWMPWNYRQTLAKRGKGTAPLGPVPAAA